MSASDLQPRRLGPFIQVWGFVRKEIVELLRQPRLLVVLVAGPFLLMLLFAVGYDQTSVRLRTLFVGPEGSIYETAIASYGDDVEEYVEVLGFTTDVVAARADLEAGTVDLVVVFPPDPAATVLEGDQAVITVLHEKLDPIQQTAVEVSAQVAISELNAAVLEELVGEAQETLVPLQQSVDESAVIAAELRRAADAGDDAAVEQAALDLRRTLTGADQVTRLSTQVVTNLNGDVDEEESARLDRFRATVTEMQAAVDTLETSRDEQELQASAATIEELSVDLNDQAGELLTIDPAVAVRPFVADTENLLRDAPRLNDFFAPSAISLLLQHLAITLAALTLIRDRGLGLFETYRVAPISTRHILFGKLLSFLGIGALVGGVLIVAVVLGLDIPLRGEPVWVATGALLLIVASIGLGLLLSTLAKSDTQAVQYAMLVLLAGMFFGGFFLSLDALRLPIRLVAWILPVTYGIRWFQDVMLRGVDPSGADIAGLVSLALAYGSLAWWSFGRRLAVR